MAATGSLPSPDKGGGGFSLSKREEGPLSGSPSKPQPSTLGLPARDGGGGGAFAPPMHIKTRDKMSLVTSF
ncbi:hypothetical protein Syun_023256 [Stephania yunnanensis]|uniref:Uncharacterized protein n=1 Tax=Stephania yunnanensis TaxID=152371 RepID=A0AAP0F8M0_9MAGN